MLTLTAPTATCGAGRRWNQLCDWLIDNDYLNRINPMRTAERRRPERHHPKSLTAEEIGKLIDAAWQENNPPRSWL